MTTQTASAVSARENARKGDGKFGEQAHSEPSLALGARKPKTAAELLGDRDKHHMALVALRESMDALEKADQIRSVRLIATHLMEKYPTASKLRIMESDNDRGTYELNKLTTADGTILEDPYSVATDWEYETVADGPELQELLWALETRDSRWADGIAENQSTKQDGKVFEINLAAARALPDPAATEATVLTTEDYEVLAEGAARGLADYDDMLAERTEDYSDSDLAAIEADRAELARVLGS